MILQALVKEYENLAQKGLVSKPGWRQKFLMPLI